MVKMIPIVMNTAFERIAEVDDYSSFIWTTRYNTCGDFEICVDVTAANLLLFQKDYLIVRDNDDRVGVVESVIIERNEDGQEILIVSGRFLSSILGRRIISRQTVINGTLSNGIEALLDNEVISPQNSARTIANLTFNSLLTTAQTITAQYTGKNLLETIADICNTYGIGFKTILTDDNEFEFTLFEGVDRSYNQSVNPYVVFSDKYDNLLSSQYSEDYQNIVTDVLVAGEGEGLDRKMLWVSNGNQRGLNRYELFDDRRDLQSNDGEISASEYNDLLEEAGKENMSTITVAFSGTVYFENIEYKTDVNIGDICTIENSKWGLSINSRLVEVIESVNEAGEYSIIPSFGL